jgi:hypothetical protein
MESLLLINMNYYYKLQLTCSTMYLQGGIFRIKRRCFQDP